MQTLLEQGAGLLHRVGGHARIIRKPCACGETSVPEARVYPHNKHRNMIWRQTQSALDQVPAVF
jgi:hypothetical protein